MNGKIEKIDLSALKFNQLSIVSLVLTGFIFNLLFLPVFVAGVLLIGSIFPSLALFKQTYKYIVVPLGLIIRWNNSRNSKYFTFKWFYVSWLGFMLGCNNSCFSKFNFWFLCGMFYLLSAWKIKLTGFSIKNRNRLKWNWY